MGTSKPGFPIANLEKYDYNIKAEDFWQSGPVTESRNQLKYIKLIRNFSKI